MNQDETTKKYKHQNMTCWIVTEGIAGTENQCIGVADALGVTPVIKQVRLRSPWKQLTPMLRWGNQWAIDPAGDALEPPWPDLLLASGRKSIPAALAIQKASKGKTFTVQIQDPRISPKNFDLVVVPQHDPARGENVIVTTGALHKVTPALVSSEAIKHATEYTHIPSPRMALLIGGDSKAHRLTAARTRELAAQVKNLVEKQNMGLFVTTSRRTGEENTNILQKALQDDRIALWDGTGDNPLFAWLGLADYILVTEDSVTMTCEALTTGKPVYTVKLDGGAPRLDRFHAGLQEQGYTRLFEGTLDKWSYDPPQDTMMVAQEIIRRMTIRARNAEK